MKLRATRGSFTWQGRHVTAGHTFEVADNDPRIDTLRRLYGAVEADSTRGRRTRRPAPEPEPVVVEEPSEEHEEGVDQDG